MDLAQATNAPEPLELAGESYPVRTLTLAEWGVIQAFLKSKAASPLTRAVETIEAKRAAGEEISYAAEECLLEHAQAATLRWPPRIGSRAWLELLDTIAEAPAEIVFVALSKTVASFSRDLARDLAGRMTADDFTRLLGWTLYGVRPVPKDAAPATTSDGAGAVAG